MKKLLHFAGVDVSKETFDVALINSNDSSHVIQKAFLNNAKGFTELSKWLKQQKVQYDETLFCVEHTGYYSRMIARFILTKKGNLWMEMSLKIIRSLGIQRGKNDKIDARRIAQYAFRNQQDYKPYNPLRPIIEKLKTLLMLRQKLINSKLSITIPVNELKRIDKPAGKEAIATAAITLKALDKNLTIIKQKIDELIVSDMLL